MNRKTLKKANELAERIDRLESVKHAVQKNERDIYGLQALFVVIEAVQKADTAAYVRIVEGVRAEVEGVFRLKQQEFEAMGILPEEDEVKKKEEGKNGAADASNGKAV